MPVERIDTGKGIDSGEGSRTRPEVYARDPRLGPLVHEHGKLPGPDEPVHDGTRVTASSGKGHWVCTRPKGSQPLPPGSTPPSVDGQSNADWHWSVGPS